MPKICAFCDADAVKDGGEHVFDDWLNREGPKTMYHAMERPTLDSPTIRYDTDKFEWKLPVVCTPCNNEWMSQITEKTKQTFGRAMLHGEPFRLELRALALLAAFTFMKAVCSYHSLTDDPFFPRDATDAFRLHHTIPDFVQCWVAAYDGTPLMRTVSRAHVFSPNPDHPLYGYQFLGFTYIVGKLALELLAPRWKDISDRGRPLSMIQPMDSFQSATLRFWPYAGSIISWPPRTYIGDDSFQPFIDRFGGPLPER